MTAQSAGLVERLRATTLSDDDIAVIEAALAASPAPSAGLEQRARELLARQYDDDDPTMAKKIREGTCRNEETNRAIPAIEAALAAPAAGGWVLVPREPTEAMEYAAVRVWDNSPADPGQLQCASDTYAAMLAAAPQAQGDG